MSFHKLKEKLHKEKKLARRVGGLFGVVLGLIMAFSFFSAKQASAFDIDLSNKKITLLAADPASINYNFVDQGWYALGIHNNGASNHSPAQATHSMTDGNVFDMTFEFPYFHPKGSKSYNGKYGNRAYTLMDDSFANKNIFKMLEVTDKSGNAGKKLRGTSKFYSGSNEWQRFEFEFVEDCGVHDCISGYDSTGWRKTPYYETGHAYKVRMRTEKTGNYIVGDGVNHGASMHVANSGDSTDLWMIVW